MLPRKLELPVKTDRKPKVRQEDRVISLGVMGRLVASVKALVSVEHRNWCLTITLMPQGGITNGGFDRFNVEWESY